MGAGAAPGSVRSRRVATPRSHATARLALLGLTLACGCSLLSAADEESAPPTSVPPSEIPVPPPAPPAGAAPVLVTSESRGARAATKIERVTIESTPPTTRVVLALDGTAEPEVSLLVNQRLVIDVPGTTCESLPRVLEAPGDPLVERVRTGQHAAPAVKSRVVVDLRERADFTVRSQDQRIVVLLAPAGSGSAAAAAPSAANVILGAEPSGDARAAAPRVSVPPPGEPLPTPAVATPAAVEPAAVEPAVVEAPPAAVAGPIATPAAEPVEAAPPPPSSEALVEATPVPVPAPSPSDEPVSPSPAPAVEPLAPVTEASPSPPPLASPATESAPAAPLVEATRAPGRISIDFTEADVRTVIDLIAAAGGYRVIFTPEVAGTVSITLVDRPWEDALATVLRAKQLREVRHEDVMLVSPTPRNGAR